MAQYFAITPAGQERVNRLRDSPIAMSLAQSFSDYVPGEYGFLTGFTWDDGPKYRRLDNIYIATTLIQALLVRQHIYQLTACEVCLYRLMGKL